MAVFVLDVSTLSGENLNYVETPFQEKGYSLTLEWVQAGANQDIRVVGHAVRAVGAETMDTDFPTSAVVQLGTAYGSGAYGAGPYGGITAGAGIFILDISRLAGEVSVLQAHSPIQERGRSIQLEWVQAGGNQDLRVIGHAVRVVPAEDQAKEPS